MEFIKNYLNLSAFYIKKLVKYGKNSHLNLHKLNATWG